MNTIQPALEPSVLRFHDPRRDATAALIAAVEDFCILDCATTASEHAMHHAVLMQVHRICAQVLECESAGMSRAEIVDILGPVRAIHARSPFVSRLQQWPRGYPGDFETVEYIWHAENRARRGTIEYFCEAYSLNLPIAQQHRNKVRHQAARILKTMLDAPRKSRILALASGSCPDFEMLQPQLESLAGEIYLNDSDENALAFSAPVFAPISDRCQTIQGNALKVARKMERMGGFDLVLAGGLFDYLPEKHAAYLIENVYHGLLGAGGTFYFTNIADGNPYRSLIEYLGDWFLIERSVEDVRDLCTRANVPDECVSIRRDETGLALLVEVTKSA